MIWCWQQRSKQGALKDPGVRTTERCSSFLWEGIASRSSPQGVAFHSLVVVRTVGAGMVGGGRWLIDKFPLEYQLHPPKLLSSCFASLRAWHPSFLCLYLTHLMVLAFAPHKISLGEPVPSLERKAPSVQWHQLPPLWCSVRWWETRNHVSSFLCFFFVFLDFTLQCDTVKGVPSSV